MDWSSAEAIVNRDDPIPVIKFEDSNDQDSTPSTPPDETSTGQRLRDKVSASKLKEKLQENVAEVKSSPSVQDRLLSALFQQILPSGDVPADTGKPDKRSREYVERPNFSLPLMSTNFRRFNSRIGIVFVFQSRLMRLFSWKDPTHTLSFLAVYSFCCLNPSLIAVLPLAACLFFVMVPAFISRHPPPQANGLIDSPIIRGPAYAPPKTIKPAPEMSKDFFRNMRDLQNSMEDFSRVHDRLVNIIAPLTNFSNERVSSTIFLALFTACCVFFINAGLVPWRATFLLGGWIVVGLSNPSVWKFVSAIDKEPIKREAKRARGSVERWMERDITLDEAPELREVEIFELQRQRGFGEWEAWLYSTSPYDPQSPLRISHDRPKGARFFEDVQAPVGWEWNDKKWTLDLFSRDWVEERMITAVEVETEGERWVYDIGASDYGGDDSTSPTSTVRRAPSKRDWEESSGLGPKGDWRRRRWVRLVRRRIHKVSPSESSSSA